jgi:hypothetical protein
MKDAWRRIRKGFFVFDFCFRSKPKTPAFKDKKQILPLCPRNVVFFITAFRNPAVA